MKNLRWSTAFSKDVKRLARRGYDLRKLNAILDALQSGAALPRSAHPHPLKGAWSGAWDCHVSPDWVLIYENAADEIRLVRTGTHADLFGT